VQVCPTGIDIRQGLQYECIGCGACADVCDTVMDKVGYARGLVKYSTQHALENKWTTSQTIRHIFRPRVLIYTGILLLVVSLLFGSLLTRKSFKVDIVRDRASLARIVSGGKIENVYRLQIMNVAEKSQHFKVTAEGMHDLKVLTETDDLVVASTQSRWVSVRLQVPFDAAMPGSYPVKFFIETTGHDDHEHEKLEEKSVFLMPR
jgi:cytochrome c oxidase accessory protein FixG